MGCKIVEHNVSLFLFSPRIVALSLSLLVLPFLPASNLLFKVGFVVAERVLYLSSAGHCALVGIGAVAIAAQSPLMKRVCPTNYCISIHNNM